MGTYETRGPRNLYIRSEESNQLDNRLYATVLLTKTIGFSLLICMGPRGISQRRQVEEGGK